ncbi:EF-hand domain-containing protein [Polynucleobacter nymphae]|uniref:EF-hand domain-containing protein n=1 Tax=Polynucleobacter nymphae TaxID=2081043 RepID=UPI001C0DD3A0|nr:EF-hand domain-containing protein [Polynucleobacter nymphae]MBU3607110.1 EF-hand domain-containing protein [Polynucleobacter nymphae]
MHFVKNLLILAACVLSALPMSASANNASRNQEIAERFAKCDTNQDGKLTRDEAKGCMPRIFSHFDYIDSSKKGYLTVAEIQAVADN